MYKRSLLMAALLSTPAAYAQSHPSLDVEASTFSQYIWRGMVLTNGPVFQTSTTGQYRGAHLNIFTNNDLDSANRRRGKFSEVDYDFGYDYTVERTTVSAGLIHYTFPNTEIDSTTELYAVAALNMPLHPSVKLFSDAGVINGSYASFDIAHSIAMPKLHPAMPWSTEFTAGFGAATKGFNRGYFGVERAGLVDFHPAIALPIALGPRFRLTPRAGYSGVVGSALGASETARAHGFYCGISLLVHLL